MKKYKLCPYAQFDTCREEECGRFVQCMQQKIEAIAKFENCEGKHKELVERVRKHILSGD